LHEVETFLKVAPRAYDRLRIYIPAGSPAHEAIEKATPIDYSLEGVRFAGYSVPCNDEQLGIILEAAKQCCPEIVPAVEQALTRSRLIGARRT
jgi:hypothetical protein